MKTGNYYKALNILGLLDIGTPLQKAVHQQATVPAGMLNTFQQALQDGQDAPYWQSSEASEAIADLRSFLSDAR